MHCTLPRTLPPFVAVICISLLGLSSLCQSQVAVTTHHNDTGRTGQNLGEAILNTSNVNVNTFGKLFSRSVDGQIYAQPLYVPNLPISGKTRNVVYVATQNDSVYAFDADDPAASSPLWQVNLGTPVPSTDVDPSCADITPQIGITSTPVIDTSSGTLYVVAKTKNTTDSSYHFSIHALDLMTGAEKFGGPNEITAQVPGTGVQSAGGVVTFYPLQHLNRPGLLLLNGVVYLAFGSMCEIPPWHGWILGYSASTLQKVAVLNTTPNGSFGGIWGGGQGLLADSANNIYVMTGNGTFDPATGGDYGNSVLKISTASGLSIVDYFTPMNQAALDAADLDLGSGGPMALPGTNLIVGSGKDGIVRVMDTRNLGQFSATTNNNVQNFQGTTGVVFMGAPVYWNSPNSVPVIYIWSGNDFLKAYELVNGTFQTTPVSQSTVVEAQGYSNSVPLSLSANGNQAGTGIVWGSGALSGNANTQTVAGILRAFDATDLTKELWDSKQNAARDDVGNYAKFSPPTIANGKVYLATFSNQLLVYGLLTDFSIAISPSNATTSVGQSATYTVTVLPISGFNNPILFSCSGLPAGATCSFSPAALTPGSGPVSSTLTVSTAATTPTGTSTVTITGVSGSVMRSSTVALDVSPMADFSIAVSPSTATTSIGQSATYTVTVLPISGFNNPILFSCSGLHGAICSFNPASLTPGSGPVSSTLTVSTAATTPTGTSTVTITGVSASLTHSSTVALDVSPIADFSIALSPATLTVSAGQPAPPTATVTLQSQGGLSSPVSLSCSGLPSRAACVFSPSSITVTNGSGTSTLSITTAAPTAGLRLPSNVLMRPLYVMWLPLVAFIGAASIGGRKWKRTKTLLCSVLFGLICAQVGCGGGTNSSPPSNGPGTPPGAYIITITGASGALQHSATVTLTVK
jgi:hypothetical protein